jgi:hypothetical protein
MLLNPNFEKHKPILLKTTEVKVNYSKNLSSFGLFLKKPKDLTAALFI